MVDIQQVKKELTEKMSFSCGKLEFERAKEYRDQIAHIETSHGKTKNDDE